MLNQANNAGGGVVGGGIPGQMPQQQQDNSMLMTFHNLSKLAEFCGTKGDYQTAIQYYERMSTLDPENGPSWTALGHCYLLTDDIHKAFNAY